VALDTLAGEVERSAAPATVRLALERLGAAHDGLADRLAADAGLAAAVVAVTAASGELTRLLATDPAAVDVLADLDRRPPVDATGRQALARWKAHEYLRIAARDLCGVDGLEEVGTALAAMAADVLHAACSLAGTEADGLAVVGMGKLGGSELNYASDVDVMLVGEDERAARQVLTVARDCFRVDANLRPEGRSGRLVRTVESYVAYWERWAEPWEFQALLKARAVAGDPDAGAAFEAAAERALWERPLSPDDLRSLRAMKARAESEVGRRGLADREVKLGPGGIRDVEFAVQLLQLVHGRADPGLRSPTTLVALEELADGGYVDRADADRLATAYRFLRRVEHALQLDEGRQVHAVPADAGARDRLARVLGYRGSPEADAVGQLDGELRRHQAAVRGIHERLYFRPLLDALAGEAGVLSPEAVEARLAAFGFADAERTRQAVRELTRGLRRSSRLMQQLLPLLLGWLADSPDPDLGLLGLRHLAWGSQVSTELAVAVRDSPETARRLCLLLGTSRLIGAALRRNPDLVPRLRTPEALVAGRRPAALDGARAAVAWRAGEAERSAALRRFTDRERLLVAAADVLGAADVAATARALTDLGEATLEAAVEHLDPPVPFAVVAMGRFGGAELSYASDLDVVLVYDGSTPADFEAAERVAVALLRFVPAWRVDVGLRPEGRQGALARSLDAYRTYFGRWAQVWERQAVLRARPVAGDPDVGMRFVEEARRFAFERPLSAEDVREIRRIKARVERERIPAGEDPQFHLKLGRGSLSDVEFCVQLLQLRAEVAEPGTAAAMSALVAAGALDAGDAAVLGDAYRFCERTRNRWFLVNGGPGDSLPSQPDRLAKLARSLDTTPAALRDDYRRVTRRARRVVERLFYGKG
jgi:[glutamine synthetase] adenylyltransferase / [glutamine synthetase]-adenylyl-L-tyrosine phosphorylase